MDEELERVELALRRLDPTGERFAAVYRQTFDQLYDGQRTGRYKWDQLFKTEKTHFGTLVEINLQREFEFEDGDLLDYKIDGIEVDCKYSFKDGGWMLPPESWDQIIMVSTANDENSSWSLGVVRVTPENRRDSVNRDGKTSLSLEGRHSIHWVFRELGMAPNVLLQLPSGAVEEIYAKKRGQARLDELFRKAEGMRIHRSSVATVAQQQDYMKRVRYNGGSRSNLRDEGFLIISGDYENQRQLAEQFGVPEPAPGELVSFRVVPADSGDVRGVELSGAKWRRAGAHESSLVGAPLLPPQGRLEED